MAFSFYGNRDLAPFQEDFVFLDGAGVYEILVEALVTPELTPRFYATVEFFSQINASPGNTTLQNWYHDFRKMYRASIRARVRIVGVDGAVYIRRQSYPSNSLMRFRVFGEKQ